MGEKALEQYVWNCPITGFQNYMCVYRYIDSYLKKRLPLDCGMELVKVYWAYSLQFKGETLTLVQTAL